MTNQSPLKDIRVLDLSRFIAGPFCTMQLGDMGADVIKVERKGLGEDTRTIEPKVAGESLYVMMYNRNKRGLALDYRHPDSTRILKDLAAKADILVENFRPGTLEAMGLDWDTLHALNPRLIVVRISGFGQDGPYARRPCFDVIAQASSGIMSLTGPAEGRPTMAGTFLVDFTTGLYATIGAMNALRARETTGLGQIVDVSLMDSAVSFLMTAIPEYLLLGREATRNGSRDRYTAPANNFQAADGEWVHISTGNDALFPRFAKKAGVEHLLSDSRFSSAAARMQNVDAVEAEVAAFVAAYPSEDVVRMMDEAGVPCAKVARISDVVNNPQLQHRKQIVEIDHPKIGKLPMHGITVNLSDTPGAIRRPPPSVGEHTQEVLAEWAGYDERRIAELRSAGAI
jgi:crotonobetainyl-CoA:carnitine CoA-transferase CaiB-like acyl-CoA transferase